MRQVGERERGGGPSGQIKLSGGHISCPQSLRTSVFNLFSAESESEKRKQMSPSAPCWFLHNNSSVCGNLSAQCKWTCFKKLDIVNKTKMWLYLLFCYKILEQATGKG